MFEMFDRRERTIIGLAISISVVLLIVIAILAMVNQQPVEQIQPEQYFDKSLPFVPMVESPRKAIKPSTDVIASPRMSLSDVIRSARTWGPAYQYWYGKSAPDFTVTDIRGQQHKLSDYRGKPVLIIFWATWCRPCLVEIPHLIELRNSVGEDKLAMLAISYIGPRNSTETVKRFVAANPIINYTVISTDVRNMPRPYSLVTSIPSSFFIDPQGRIKFATSGLVSLDAIKAILQAPLEESYP